MYNVITDLPKGVSNTRSGYAQEKEITLDFMQNHWHNYRSERVDKACGSDHVSFSDKGPLFETLELFEITHSNYQPLNFLPLVEENST